MKITYFLPVVILFTQCKIDQKENLNSERTGAKISMKDSLYIEDEIKQYKNCLFSEMYSFSLKKTYKRLRITPKKSVKDLTYFYYSDFNPAFMLKDSNRDKMFDKWLNDKRYEPITEITDGSLDIVRALDFYNSKDLEIYLDSLKSNEYQRIMNRR